MLNTILGKKIFPEKNEESTSTICKIRNSERIRIIAEHSSGKKTEIDLTDRCDLETKEGVTLLRKELRQLTDLTQSQESKHFRNVDIGLPVPFLKVNSHFFFCNTITNNFGYMKIYLFNFVFSPFELKNQVNCSDCLLSVVCPLVC